MAKATLKLTGTFEAWAPNVRTAVLVRANGSEIPVLVWILEGRPATEVSLGEHREEGRLLARLQHEHALRVEQTSGVGGQLAVVYESFDCVAVHHVLAALAARGQGLPSRVAVEIAAAVGIALEEALKVESGEARLGHQAPTPPMVLLDTSGRVKLAGIEVLRPTDKHLVPRPGYLPPEGRHSWQAATWMAGALLVELLTGEPPPEGSSDPVRHEQSVRRAVLRVLSRPGDAPPEVVVAAIKQALAHSPSTRGTPGTWGRMLRDVAVQLSTPGLRAWAPGTVPAVQKLALSKLNTRSQAPIMRQAPTLNRPIAPQAPPEPLFGPDDLELDESMEDDPDATVAGLPLSALRSAAANAGVSGNRAGATGSLPLSAGPRPPGSAPIINTRSEPRVSPPREPPFMRAMPAAATPPAPAAAAPVRPSTPPASPVAARPVAPPTMPAATMPPPTRAAPAPTPPLTMPAPTRMIPASTPAVASPAPPRAIPASTPAVAPPAPPPPLRANPASTPAVASAAAPRTIPASTPAIPPPAPPRAIPASTPAIPPPVPPRAIPASTPAIASPAPPRAISASTPAIPPPAPPRAIPASTPAIPPPVPPRATPASTPAVASPVPAPAAAAPAPALGPPRPAASFPASSLPLSPQVARTSGASIPPRPEVSVATTTSPPAVPNSPKPAPVPASTSATAFVSSVPAMGTPALPVAADSVAASPVIAAAVEAPVVEDLVVSTPVVRTPVVEVPAAAAPETAAPPASAPAAIETLAADEAIVPAPEEWAAVAVDSSPVAADLPPVFAAAAEIVVPAAAEPDEIETLAADEAIVPAPEESAAVAVDSSPVAADLPPVFAAAPEIVVPAAAAAEIAASAAAISVLQPVHALLPEVAADDEPEPTARMSRETVPDTILPLDRGATLVPDDDLPLPKGKKAKNKGKRQPELVPAAAADAALLGPSIVSGTTAATPLGPTVGFSPEGPELGNRDPLPSSGPSLGPSLGTPASLAVAGLPLMDTEAEGEQTVMAPVSKAGPALAMAPDPLAAPIGAGAPAGPVPRAFVSPLEAEEPARSSRVPMMLGTLTAALVLAAVAVLAIGFWWSSKDDALETISVETPVSAPPTESPTAAVATEAPIPSSSGGLATLPAVNPVPAEKRVDPEPITPAPPEAKPVPPAAAVAPSSKPPAAPTRATDPEPASPSRVTPAAAGRTAPTEDASPTRITPTAAPVAAAVPSAVPVAPEAPAAPAVVAPTQFTVQFVAADPGVTLEVKCMVGSGSGTTVVITDTTRGNCRVVGRSEASTVIALVSVSAERTYRCFAGGTRTCQ